MIGVDKIGAIRRAYFEEHRPIKEIVRTPSVSRGKVRKVIRSHETELKYEQGGFHIPPQAPRFRGKFEFLTNGEASVMPR